MAVAAKSKGPASDSIMMPDKMKPILATSKQEPVSAAIGLTADGEGLLLLHKKAKPKQVLSMLRAEAGKAKLQLNNASMRFGRAEVDPDYDPGMVRFFVNKETPGVMRVKLVEVVKRVPYQKVEINVDPSLEEESEDEAEGHAAAAADSAAPEISPPPVPEPPPAAATPTNPVPAAPAPDAAMLTAQLRTLLGQIPAAAGDDAARKAELVQLASVANGEIKANNLDAAAAAIARLGDALGGARAAPIPPAPPVAPDDHALAAELAALLHRIPQVAGTDAALRAQLLKLATDANAGLKSHDQQAADLLARLREALDGAGAAIGTAQPANDPASAPAGKKSGDELLALFRDAKDEVDDGLNKLRAALLGTGDVDMARIAEYGMYGMTDGGGVGLMKALFDLRGAGPDKANALSKAARDAATAYKAAIFADDVVDLVDDNPLGVEVGIRAKLGAALDTIAASA